MIIRLLLKTPSAVVERMLLVIATASVPTSKINLSKAKPRAHVECALPAPAPALTYLPSKKTFFDLVGSY
jgi:hypothetical protein